MFPFICKITLVIGVVINSMDEMKAEMASEYPGYDNLADSKRQEIIISCLDRIEEKLNSVINR